MRGTGRGLILQESEAMAGTSPMPGPRLPRTLVTRISLAVCVAAAAAMIGAGGVRLLKDGSLWLDEASIAYNLLYQTPAELMGPLLTTHSFPRLYLAVINGLTFAFGYHTLVLRILPYCFFVLGVLVWQRLGWQRFKQQPLLLASFVLLGLIPCTYVSYAAMVKQYSLDVLLALVPFLVSDAFFDRHLRRGEQSWRLLALAVPCLVSFTYPIPLIARVAGWYVSGLRQRGFALSLRGFTTAGTGLTLGLAALWWIDMRHTAGNQSIFRFWRKCTLGGDSERNLAITERLFTGWYTDKLPWGSGASLSEPLIFIIGVATLLGGAEALRRAFSSGKGDDEELAGWGSRSAGCAFVVIGVIAAGVVVRYPLCPGRLSLFALFAMQMLTVEGLYGIARFAERPRFGRIACQAAMLALVLALLPTAYHQVRHLYTKDVPENVRPLLHVIDENPDIPVLVPACSEKQLSTLPEWLDRDDIYYYAYRTGNWRDRYPPAREFFVLSAGTNFYCPWFFKQMEQRIEHKLFFSTRANSAHLVKVRLREGLAPPTPAEMEAERAMEREAQANPPPGGLGQP